MAVKWLKTKYPSVRYYEHIARKTKNGQTDKYFAIRYTFQGKRKEEGLGWATDGWNAEKAHEVLATIKNSIRTGIGPYSLAEMRQDSAKERAAVAQEEARENAAHMLLQDFFEHYYIPAVKRTKRSWLTDKQRFSKAIKPALGAKPLRMITRNDVQALIDALVDSGAAPSTAKQYRSILSHIFTQASQTELYGRAIFVGQSPVMGVKVPPIRNARERFLTAHEAHELVEKAKELPCIDLHDSIVLSLNTGLRMGELQRLEWYDIDLTHGMLTVREEANRKPGGKVPLNAAATAVLQRRLQGRGESQLVFPPLWGNTLRTALGHEFKALADTVGLNSGIAETDRSRRIVFHSLRHTFASWLAMNGTDIYRIKTLMRHKTIAMTMRYAHLIPDATRDAVHNLQPPTLSR